jgi:hypothetical protein
MPLDTAAARPDPMTRARVRVGRARREVNSGALTGVQSHSATASPTTRITGNWCGLPGGLRVPRNRPAALPLAA